MASVIKLKRSLTPSSVPSLLQEGELAVNLSDRKLFIGGENGGANVVSISGDQYNLSTAGTGNTATLSLTVDNDALSNDTISFVGGAGITVAESSGIITITNDGTVGGSSEPSESPLTFNGTASEVEVARVGNTVTVGLPDDITIGNDLSVTRNATVSGSLQVDGDLTVEGETTYISSSTVQVDDTMVKLSANNVGDTVDHGVYAKYIDGATEKFAGYFRDSSDGSVFKFYKNLEVEPTTTVNISGAGYELAQVDAIIDGGTY